MQSNIELTKVNPENEPIDWDSVPIYAASLAQLKRVVKASRLEQWALPWVVPVPANDTPTSPAPEHDAPHPLADLPRLRAVAMVGAAQIRSLAAKPVTWVWDGYIVDGSIVGLVGKSSGGKTTLLFLLILARASHGYTFNGRTLKPAPDGKYIVLIENEHSAPSAARKLVRSAQLIGLDETQTTAALDRLIVVSRKSVQLDSPEWRDVCTLIERGLVSDVMLDTLASSSSGDSNSEKEQGELFDRLKRGLEKAPNGECPTAWVVMHTRKDGAASLEDISGSAQRGAQLDSCIHVAPTRAEKSQQVIGSTVTLIKQREDGDDVIDAFELTITKSKAPDLVIAAGSKQKASSGAGYEPSEADLDRMRAVCRTVGEANYEASRAKYGAKASMVIKLQEVRSCKDPTPGKADRIKPCLDALVAQGFLVRDDDYENWYGPGDNWDSPTFPASGAGA